MGAENVFLFPFLLDSFDIVEGDPLFSFGLHLFSTEVAIPGSLSSLISNHGIVFLFGEGRLADSDIFDGESILYEFICFCLFFGIF